MDTSRTVLILICVLFITMRPSEEQTSTMVTDATMPASTTNPGDINNASGTFTTQKPPKESASSSVGLSSTAVTSTVGNKSATASSATKTGPGGSVEFSATTVTPSVGGGYANQSATIMDPNSTQSANMSYTTVQPGSGVSDATITNKNGQMVADKPHSTLKPDTPDNKKYLWIMLPVGVAVVAVAMYFRYKFFKVHHHPETTDNGTENASFQRTESNRDGVTLLGVKSSGIDEGAAA